MGTNGTDIAAEPRLEEEIFHNQKVDHSQAPGPLDKTPARKRALDNRVPDAECLRSAGGADPVETAEDFVLAPLVDKIAYGIARGLVVAMKELENHIASETRKVGDTVDRRLDTLQISLQDLSLFVREQRATNIATQDQLQQLTVAAAGLRETDARQAAELEALRTEAREFSASVSQRIDISTASLQESDARQGSELEGLRTETRAFSSSVSQRIDVTVAALQESDARQAADLAALQNETRALFQSVSERIDSLCKEFGVQQEDIAAVKATLCTFCSRVGALAERLDRQADAFRSMSTAYSQRETELEQLVDGLARLRAYPTPLPTTGL
jgi:chromosome segregation ATPase